MSNESGKLSLNLNGGISSGLTDVRVGDSGYGGTGGSGGLSKPPHGSSSRGDVYINDSITRDASGHQTSVHDTDQYWLA